MNETAKIFRALADPTRRQILEELKQGPLSAGEIATRFPVSAPTISRRLSLLEAAGLVSYHRQANRLIYRAESESLASALNGFLSAVCPTQILERKRRKECLGDHPKPASRDHLKTGQLQTRNQDMIVVPYL
ncbi:MAG TPA: metalloregulator ArsR/SmtB family transcription factor [Verrucomicrobiae bacterium]|nr:metalloregulator ArsR/SmtB family transcription factor [Verrucomicrobiae bacterium]